MNWILAAAGVVLITTAMLDALWTTITSSGGGPITARLSEGIWHAMLRIHRRDSARSHRMLQVAGSAILLMIISVWILLLWTGWVLLFAADHGAVVSSQYHIPAELPGRIYFTGYTLFTLGIGNYVPQGGVWEVLTAAASLNGLFLITLAITYLVPIVSAAVEKRQLAATIADLGRSPSTILTRAWDGKGFDGLSTPLMQLLPMIELHEQRHLAYPVLHYFHSPQLRTAISPSLAMLDEAMFLMETGVDPKVRPVESVTSPIRDAIAGLLGMLQAQYIREAAQTPAVPGLARLAAAGIPVTAEEILQEHATDRARHRRLLLAYVRNDGWTWEDVFSGESAAATGTTV